MRALRLCLLLSPFVASLAVVAQPNYVPDVDFRAALNTEVPGLVGSDGYITDTGTLLNLTIGVGWSPYDLTGLEFLNVDTLRIGVQPFHENGIIPAFPPTTRYLQLQMDGLELPAFPPTLETLLITSEVADATDLPALPAGLLHLSISSLGLTALPALPAGLQSLQSVGSWQLTDVGTLPAGLRRLSLGEASVPELEVPSTVEHLTLFSLPLLVVPTLPPVLDSLYVLNLTNLLELPVLPAGLRYLSWQVMRYTALPALPASLRHLEVSDNNRLQKLPSLPEGLEYLVVSINQELHCLPWLPSTLTYFYTDLPCVPNQPQGLEPLPLCDFLASGCPRYPAITGHVFYDEDGDGTQDPDERGAEKAVVRAVPGDHQTRTDAQGDYVLPVDAGAYTVTVRSAYTTASESEPAAHNVVVPEGEQRADFALVCSGPCVLDHRVLLSESSQPRPGFVSRLHVQWDVDPRPGPATLTVTLTPGETYEGSSLEPAIVNENVMVWYVEGNGQLYVDARLDAGMPLGGVITDQAEIDLVEGDPTPQNNTAQLRRTIVGSFDPNDKQVSPALLTPMEVAADTVVDYRIRFQNTGTFYAERVIITDTLPVALRLETFRFVQASHAAEWYIRDGVLHVVFNDIFLPDSTTDEVGSHGFVRFAVRPSTALQQGESVTNIANIYFDFNEPVITEPCILRIDLPTSVPQHRTLDLAVHPVPVRDVLHVALAGNSLWTLDVLGLDGRVVRQLGRHGTVAMIAADAFPAGAYVLRARDAEGHARQVRFVKE
ncbi:MAG: hypothetical protein JNM62_13845 [Flavobacteriales bacterium]|nr:hypothetical protein [Flavobacteriales bacterium]